MSERDAPVTPTTDDYVSGLLERIKRDERDRVIESLTDRLHAAKLLRNGMTWTTHPAIETRLYLAGYIDGLATAIESLQ